MIEREQYTLDDEGKLVFKEGVETIEELKDDDYEKVREVIMNDSAKVIGEQAFSECGELTAVSVPSSVVEIGSCAFCRRVTKAQQAKRMNEMGWVQSRTRTLESGGAHPPHPP
jgi:FKBP-type peptidyl-prolyl cis-trans isomerase (trigger factor)